MPLVLQACGSVPMIKKEVDSSVLIETPLNLTIFLRLLSHSFT